MPLYDLNSSLNSFRTWVLQLGEQDDLMITKKWKAWDGSVSMTSMLCRVGIGTEKPVSGGPMPVWTPEQLALAQLLSIFQPEGVPRMPSWMHYEANEQTRKIREKATPFAFRHRFRSVPTDRTKLRDLFLSPIAEIDAWLSGAHEDYFKWTHIDKNGVKPVRSTFYLFVAISDAYGFLPMVVSIDDSGSTFSGHGRRWTPGFDAPHFQDILSHDVTKPVKKIRAWWKRIYSAIHEEKKVPETLESINLKRALEYQERIFENAANVKKMRSLLENLSQSMDNGTVGKQQLEDFLYFAAESMPELTKLKNHSVTQGSPEETLQKIETLITGEKRK